MSHGVLGWARRHIRALLVGYGILVALVGTFVFTGTPQRSPELQSARVDAIKGSITVLDRGGPPLLRSTGGQPSSAEAGDDPGMILYLSLLGHAFGSSDPLQLLKWFFVGAFAVLLAVYPILWFELLSSLAAAVISPLLILLQFRFLAIHDIYWISAWCILLCIPCIMLVYQRWGRASLIPLAALMLIASFASSIRANAGLPILLAAVIVIFLRIRSWTRRLIYIAVLAVGYTAISGASISAIRHYRDASVGVNLSHEFTSGHTLWHPAYLGLGYLPNNYGIKLQDSVGLRAARRENPNIRYLSPQYERTIRRLYLDFARRHPRFVLRVYSAKAVVVASDAFRRFWLAFLLVPAMLLVRTRLRTEMRRFTVLLLPAAGLGVIPPILWVPGSTYESGWLGTWGLEWLLAILWLTTLIPWPVVASRALNWGSAVIRSVRWRTRLPIIEAHAAGPNRLLHHTGSLVRSEQAVRWSFGILVCVFALGLGLDRLAESVRAESATQFSVTTELARVPVRHGPTLKNWVFGRRPARWSWLEGVRERRRPGYLDVLTNHESFGYQAISPALQLRPGAYGVLIHGEVRAGGLGLGVLDVLKRRFIVSDLYSAEQRHSQRNFENGRMLAKFSLASDAKIQLVLSNWAPESKVSSRWRLQTVSLVRRERPCGCSPPDSDAWVSH